MPGELEGFWWVTQLYYWVGCDFCWRKIRGTELSNVYWSTKIFEYLISDHSKPSPTKVLLQLRASSDHSQSVSQSANISVSWPSTQTVLPRYPPPRFSFVNLCRGHDILCFKSGFIFPHQLVRNLFRQTSTIEHWTYLPVKISCVKMIASNTFNRSCHVWPFAFDNTSYWATSLNYNRSGRVCFEYRSVQGAELIPSGPSIGGGVGLPDLSSAIRRYTPRKRGDRSFPTCTHSFRHMYYP